MRATKNRPLYMDYAEPLHARTSRERRTRIATGIRNTGAALILIASLFAVQHLDRIVTEYVTLKEEVADLRTKVADLQTWDCRDYERGGRQFRWCSRASQER